MNALSSNPAIKETSMKRKILWALLAIWLILTAYLLFLSNKWASAATPSYAASSAVTTDNFAELLRETLQKNPDLLLSVLRENSEAVPPQKPDRPVEGGAEPAQGSGYQKPPGSRGR